MSSTRDTDLRAGERPGGQATNVATGTKYTSQPMTSTTTGRGCRPSIPVSSDDCTEPGLTSHVRSKVEPWPALSQPASCAVCSALTTRPAATSTSTKPVARKNFDRFSRTPPR